MSETARFAFVPSTAIPDWMAEKVAKTAHRRGCGSFNGQRSVAPLGFTGLHRKYDLTWASIHLSDVCNALKITPEQIADLLEEDAGESDE